MKKYLKDFKVSMFIALGIIFLFIVLFVGNNFYEMNKKDAVYELSDQEKTDDIEALVSLQDYDGARNLNEKYYANNKGEYYNDNIYKIQFCEDNNLKSFSAIEELKKEEEEREILNKITNDLEKDESVYSNIDVTIEYINRYMRYWQNHSTDHDLVIDKLYKLKEIYYKKKIYGIVLDNNVKCVNPTIGMSKKEVVALTKFLKPRKINKTTNKYGTSEQWCYDGYYLYFDNGKLTSIQE